MHALLLAMLLTAQGEMPQKPAPSPPVIMYDWGMVNYRPAPPIRGFISSIVSAPAPLPRASRPTTRVSGCLDCYFSGDDYPARAARAREEGAVAFQLEVAPTGRVRGCTITGPSGSPDLDRAVCRILIRRAHFRPAMAGGNAVADAIVGTVRWRLPEAEGRAGLPIVATPARLLTPDAHAVTEADYPRGAPRYTPRGSVLRVAIGRTGRVIACEVLSGSSSTLLDAAACPLYAARARYAPARNGVGAVACDVVRDYVGWNTPMAERRAPYPRPRAARLPPPLRTQLNARLCPGWSAGEPTH